MKSTSVRPRLITSRKLRQITSLLSQHAELISCAAAPPHPPYPYRLDSAPDYLCAAQSSTTAPNLYVHNRRGATCLARRRPFHQIKHGERHAQKEEEEAKSRGEEEREICAFFFPFSTSTLGVCLEISEAASSTTHALFPTPKGKGENHVFWTASQYYILLVGGAGSSTNLLTVKGKGSQIKGESWFSF